MAPRRKPFVPPRPPQRHGAGPPTPLPELGVWIVLGLAAYCCFIVLPRRASGPLHPKTRSGRNDLANAASHLFCGSFILPALDLGYRALALLTQAPVHCAAFCPAAFGTAEPQGAVASAVASLRALWFDRLQDAAFTAPGPKDPRPPRYVEGYLTHRETFALLATAAGVLWLLATVRLYAIPAYRECRRIAHGREERFREMERRRAALEAKRPDLPMRRQAFEEAVQLEEEAVDYVPDPDIVPPQCWTFLWFLIFGLAFVFVKGTPLMTGIVFPGVVCTTAAFCIFIP